MSDLKNKKLIVLKGILFMVIAGISSFLLYVENPTFKTVFVVAVLIWSAARAYYFLFYVLHEYVDPRYKYAGVMSMLKWIVKTDK